MSAEADMFCIAELPCIGRVCSDAVRLLQIGAAAFMGGATRMTLTTTVMVMETTGALQLIVPLMITVFVAKAGFPLHAASSCHECQRLSCSIAASDDHFLDIW